VEAAELEWLAWTNPITTALGVDVAGGNLSGRTIACHQHILPDTILVVGPFVAAGARVRMVPCNVDSTDDRAAAHLASMGVEVRGRSGMSMAEHAAALE
jgi:adenosylhomocysteinase